jgi:hypothetical protein
MTRLCCLLFCCWIEIARAPGTGPNRSPHEIGHGGCLLCQRSCISWWNRFRNGRRYFVFYGSVSFTISFAIRPHTFKQMCRCPVFEPSGLDPDTHQKLTLVKISCCADIWVPVPPLPGLTVTMGAVERMERMERFDSAIVDVVRNQHNVQTCASSLLNLEYPAENWH